MIDFPLYNIERLGAAARNAWQALEAVPLPPAFRATQDAEAAYAEGFRLMYRGEIPEAFYRRIMFRALKYAAIYHVLLGKTSDTLDAADMGWAARVSALHLQDMRKIAEKKGLLRDALDLTEKAQITTRRFRAIGKPLTARALQQTVWGIKTAPEAQALLEIVDSAA